jgi:hypothetical protein
MLDLLCKKTRILREKFYLVCGVIRQYRLFHNPHRS